MGALRVLVGLHAYVLPFAIAAAWIGVALWDLSRREGLSRGATIGWVLLILLVPVVGPAIALLTSPTLPRALGTTFVGGGIASYLVVLAVATAIGAA